MESVGNILRKDGGTLPISTRILGFAAIVIAGTLVAPPAVSAANPFADKVVEMFSEMAKHASEHGAIHTVDSINRQLEAAHARQPVVVTSVPALDADQIATIESMVAAMDLKCARNLNCYFSSDARYMSAQSSPDSGPTSFPALWNEQGVCFASGQCLRVAQNLGQARQNFRAAAQYGNADAITNLGMMCAVGLGGTADRPCLLRAGLIAEAKGDGNSLYKLGITDPNPGNAVRFLIRSMDYGKQDARRFARQRCLEVALTTRSTALAMCQSHNLL